MIEPLAALGRPLQELHGAVDRDALFVAGDQERDRALGLAAVRRKIVERRRDLAGDRALHVDGAAPVEHAVHDAALERRMRPRRLRRRSAPRRCGRRTRDAARSSRCGHRDCRHPRCRARRTSCDAPRSPRPSAHRRDRQARRLPPASPSGSARGRARRRSDRWRSLDWLWPERVGPVAVGTGRAPAEAEIHEHGDPKEGDWQSKAVEEPRFCSSMTRTPTTISRLMKAPSAKNRPGTQVGRLRSWPRLAAIANSG